MFHKAVKKITFSSIIIVSIFAFVPGAVFSQETESSALQDSSQSLEAKFQEFINRENDKITLHEVKGEINISLLASAEPEIKQVDGDENFEIKIPIGSGAPVVCFTAEKNSDVPHAYLKSFFDHMEKNQQIEKRALKTIQAGLIQDLPYIFIETEYLTVDKKYGRVKSLAFSVTGNSFFCFHDELGFNKTFLNVVSSLVQSDFTRDLKERFANYNEKQIDLIYLNGVSVGFFENYEFEDENHNRSLLTISSMIMPRNSSDLIGMGTLTSVNVDKVSGEVQSEKHYSYINNEVNHELLLDRKSSNTYQIKGNYSGKEVDKTFKTESPLMSSSAIIKDFLKDSEKKEVSFQEYSPLSPLGASSSNIVSKGLQKDGTTLLEYTIHSQTYNFAMDKNGYRSLKMSMGPVQMTLKRSFYDRKH